MKNVQIDLHYDDYLIVVKLTTDDEYEVPRFTVIAINEVTQMVTICFKEIEFQQLWDVAASMGWFEQDFSIEPCLN